MQPWLRALIGALTRERRPPHVICFGNTLSGIPHLGDLREPALAHAIVRELHNVAGGGGGKSEDDICQLVFVDYDLDPLPNKPYPHLDSEFVSRNFGRPLMQLPDPWGCCPSYHYHQATAYHIGLQCADIQCRKVRTSEVYSWPSFRTVARAALADWRQCMKVLRRDGPLFYPLCPHCGRYIMEKVELDEDEVRFTCPHCRTAGCADPRLLNGKFTFAMEWALLWIVLDTACEPCGRAHCGPGGAAERAARAFQLLSTKKPPLLVPWEWVRSLDGRYMRSSWGNIVTFQELERLYGLEQVREYLGRLNPRRSLVFHPVNFAFTLAAHRLARGGFTSSDIGLLVRLVSISATPEFYKEMVRLHGLDPGESHVALYDLRPWLGMGYATPSPQKARRLLALLRERQELDTSDDDFLGLFNEVMFNGLGGPRASTVLAEVPREVLTRELVTKCLCS